MHKIAIVSQYFSPSHISTAQLMTDLVKGLSENYTVLVFSGTKANSESDSLSSEKIKIIRCRSINFQSHSILIKLINSLLFIISGIGFVLFQTSPNTPLLIASNPPYAGVLGLLFKLFKGGRYYFLIQDIFPESALLAGILRSNGVLFHLFSAINYLICCHSGQTIVLTTSMQQFLEKKTRLPGKFCLIENWAIEPIQPCDKQDNTFAIEHGCDRKFTILYSGNLGRLHDIESILEAAKLLRDQPIQWLFIGNGAKKKLVEQAIVNAQLKNVLLLPLQARDQLSLTLTACDLALVSLIPGAEQIVAPCKLYGILAAGRAVLSISSPGSYLDRLVKDADCGVNCPPNQPQYLAKLIQELADNPTKIHQMGQQARQLYERQYTFERALNQYETLLAPSLHHPVC